MTPDEERTAYLDNLEEEYERKQAQGHRDEESAALFERLRQIVDKPGGPDEAAERRAKMQIAIVGLTTLVGGGVIAGFIGLWLR